MNVEPSPFRRCTPNRLRCEHGPGFTRSTSGFRSLSVVGGLEPGWGRRRLHYPGINPAAEVPALVGVLDALASLAARVVRRQIRKGR